MHNAVPRAPATEEITIATLQQFMRELCEAFVQEAGDFANLEEAMAALDKKLCKQIELLGMNLPFGEEPAHIQIIDEFLANHYNSIKQAYIPALQNKIKPIFLGWALPSLSLPEVPISHTNENSGVRGFAPTL